MTMFFDFGTDTGLSTDIVAGDGSYDLASRIADVINDLTSFTAKRGGTSNDNAAYVIVQAANDDGGTDVTPVRRETLPSSITISRTYVSATKNLASWSANATNAETSYTLSVGTGVARYAGLTVTMKHTNTAQNRSVSMHTNGDFFGAASELDQTSFWANGSVSGGSATVDAQIGSYVRDFADASGGAAGAAGENTNRMSWTD